MCICEHNSEKDGCGDGHRADPISYPTTTLMANQPIREKNCVFVNTIQKEMDGGLNME